MKMPNIKACSIRSLTEQTNKNKLLGN